MSESIMQTKKECYLTGAKTGLHKHHIFGAFNRERSETWGLWVWLKWDRHIENSPHRTPHNDVQIDMMLKKAGQREFEKRYGHDVFMREFGRNYL